jgi:hypothetical protein
MTTVVFTWLVPEAAWNREDLPGRRIYNVMCVGEGNVSDLLELRKKHSSPPRSNGSS